MEKISSKTDQKPEKFEKQDTFKGDGRDSFLRVILGEIAFFMQKINILGMYRFQFFIANLFAFMQFFDSTTRFGRKWSFNFWHFWHFFIWAKMAINWKNTLTLATIDEFTFMVPTCYEKKLLKWFLKPDFQFLPSLVQHEKSWIFPWSHWKRPKMAVSANQC